MVKTPWFCMMIALALPILRTHFLADGVAADRHVAAQRDLSP